MSLKVIIIILFIAVIISLSSSLVFILKDTQSQSKQGVYTLGIRITLALLLLGTIFYGLYIGELGSGAPWDKKLTKDQIEQKLR